MLENLDFFFIILSFSSQADSSAAPHPSPVFFFFSESVCLFHPNFDVQTFFFSLSVSEETIFRKSVRARARAMIFVSLLRS